MKKRFIISAAIAVALTLGGYGVNKYFNPSNPLSQIAMENLEALSRSESVDEDCIREERKDCSIIVCTPSENYTVTYSPYRYKYDPSR